MDAQALCSGRDSYGAHGPPRRLWAARGSKGVMDVQNNINDYYSQENVRCHGNGMNIDGSNMDILTRVELEVPFASEKLLNLEMLVMEIARMATDFEPPILEDESVSSKTAKSSFELDILYGIRDAEVRELDEMITSLQNDIQNVEHKMKDLISDIRKESAKFEKAIEFSRDEEAKNAYEILLGTSKELVDRISTIQFQLSASRFREDEMKSKLKESLIRLSSFQEQSQQSGATGTTGCGLTVVPHIESRARHFRTKFGAIKVMLNKSGFAWDESRKMVQCEKQQHDEHYKKNNEAKGLYGVAFSHYDRLATIYGRDIATREGAEGLGEAIANVEKEIEVQDVEDDEKESVSRQVHRQSFDTSAPRRSFDSATPRWSVDSTALSSKKRKKDKDIYKWKGTLPSDPFMDVFVDVQGDLKSVSQHVGTMAASMQRKVEI
uniref:Uncharacterized protein n=1 Tax=Oryza brachyantha TaxID=4533 RepID=J3M572_ORYBR